MRPIMYFACFLVQLHLECGDIRVRSDIIHEKWKFFLPSMIIFSMCLGYGNDRELNKREITLFGFFFVLFFVSRRQKKSEFKYILHLHDIRILCGCVNNLNLNKVTSESRNYSTDLGCYFYSLFQKALCNKNAIFVLRISIKYYVWYTVFILSMQTHSSKF